MGPIRYASILTALSAFLVACQPEEEPGPIGRRFDSPTGVAVLGSSHVLVTNANFQLRYNGGSLAAIDLSLVDESARFNDADLVVSSAVELPSFVGPVALAPDGTTALVTNRLSDEDTNDSLDRVFLVDVSDPADLRTRDPANVVVDRDPFGVLPLRLPPSGPGRPVRDRAIVANANGASLAVVNLTEGTRCSNTDEAPCTDDAVPPPRATAPVFEDAGDPSELVFEGPGIAPDVTRTERWTITFIEAAGVCPVPATPDVPAGYWRVEGSASGVMRTHACTGELYVGDSLRITFTIRRTTSDAGVPVGAPPTEGDRFTLETHEGDFDTTSFLELGRTLPNGTIFGRGVGYLAHDPLRGRIYATSRRTNFVYAVDADDMRHRGAYVVVTNSGGVDSRGIAVAPDGEWIYVVNRSPNALLFLDPDTLDETRLDLQIVQDAVVDSVPVEEGASELVLSPDGRYAFVSCFDADRVNVIDLETRLQVATIPTANGPFGMAISPDGRRLYVATYFDHAVEVIDVEAASPTFTEVLTVIASSDLDPDR